MDYLKTGDLSLHSSGDTLIIHNTLHIILDTRKKQPRCVWFVIFCLPSLFWISAPFCGRRENCCFAGWRALVSKKPLMIPYLTVQHRSNTAMCRSGRVMWHYCGGGGRVCPSSDETMLSDSILNSVTLLYQRGADTIGSFFRVSTNSFSPFSITK